METWKPDFTPQPAIEGPMVSEVGIILAIITALVLVLDYLGKKRSVKQ